MIGKDGYSLIESIMVLVIVGIIAGVGVPIMMAASDAWSVASQLQDNAVSSSIVAANRMSREMRRLLDDSSVTTADASNFSFTDLDSNVITFNRSGNILMRNSDGLASNVTALNFVYYDDAGNTIATPLVNPNDTDMRRIQTSFSILAGTSTLNFQFVTRPQNLRRLNEKFK